MIKDSHKKIKVPELQKAIKGSYGLRSVIADRLGVPYGRVAQLISASKMATVCFQEEIARTSDLIWSQIIKRCQEGDPRMIALFAKAGFGGHGLWDSGLPQALESAYDSSGNLDVSRLTDEELRALAGEAN